MYLIVLSIIKGQKWKKGQKNHSEHRKEVVINCNFENNNAKEIIIVRRVNFQLRFWQCIHNNRVIIIHSLLQGLLVLSIQIFDKIIVSVF